MKSSDKLTCKWKGPWNEFMCERERKRGGGRERVSERESLVASSYRYVAKNVHACLNALSNEWISRGLSLHATVRGVQNE